MGKFKDVDSYNVSGGNRKNRDVDVDERGKLRNKDDGRQSVKKAKKKKKVERDLPVIEDNTYKSGKETKVKKKKKGEKSLLAKDDSKPKKKKTTAVAELPKALQGELVPVDGGKPKKVSAKKREAMLDAIEEYAQLPPPVDEFDAETRRMFENLVSLATRLEEQMEDRIYGRDVYALNAIYTQVREIIADLRATRDISAQVEELKSLVLGPYHKVVGQALGDIYFHMNQAINKFLAQKDPDIAADLMKKLKSSCSDAGEVLQGEFGQAIERIAKVIA